MTPIELAAVAKRAAAELGFDACGVTSPDPVPHGDALERWLDAGMHGAMRYMTRQYRIREQPARAWPAARSIVVVLHNYYCGTEHTSGGYRISRYAQGVDYHTVMWEKLDALGAAVVAAAGRGTWRSYADAGPLPERELAQRAGLGWIGKNTMLIRPGLGSYTFIGSLLTDLSIALDEPFEADRCGTCTRCLEACPTAAFPEPRVLDARRCISYLTIEAPDEPPADLRRLVGDHLFGCDVCQEVCPWNVSFAGETAEPRFRSTSPWPSLEEIVGMDDAGFAARFGHTALERARRAGLQRNARVIMENRASGSAGDTSPRMPPRARGKPKGHLPG
jgi:epoxyqueuosine reductase